MKKNKIITSLLSIAILTSASYAGGKYVEPVDAEVAPIPEIIIPMPLYIGLGLVATGLSRDCLCVDSNRVKDMTYGGLVRVGWDFNPYIGIEARALKTNIEKDFSETTHYGIYLKPQYHVTEQSNVYGLLGYGRTIVDYDCKDKKNTLTKDGFSYGIGFEYDFNEDQSEGEYSRSFDGQGDQEGGWGMWVDLQHLLHHEGEYKTDSNLLSVGVTYDF